MKKSKIFLYISLAVFVLTLAALGIYAISGSEYYNYEGHIVDIREENGNTVITTLNGNKRSDFTIKWYTKKKMETSNNKLEIGDFVRLTTTHFSNINIKKIRVSDGYIHEGKLVYFNEADGAFLLYELPETQTKHLFHLVSFENRAINGNLGEKIRVYRSFGLPDIVPPSSEDLSLLVNCTEKIADADTPAFDESELALISSFQYTIKEDEA